MFNLNSDRGRIQPPNLDDRTWQDLVNEAVALIPSHAPQWTDYSTSDLGITLIELFAWLVEGLTYRLNQVPDKNYIAFLNLLGITREPAVPAHVFLTFMAQPPAAGQPATPVTVPKGTKAQTQGTETQSPIIFETDADLNVLPTNLKTVLQISKNTYANITPTLAAPPAKGNTITLQPAQSVQLALGFDQQTATAMPLGFHFTNPITIDPSTITKDPSTTKPQATVSWFYSTGTDPSTWSALAGQYTDNTQGLTNGLQQDGIVTVTPPVNLPSPGANWTAQAPTSWAIATPATPADHVTDTLFWIGITITNRITTPVQIGLGYILFNAVSAHNALTIPVPESLGQSDGTPFQALQLQHYPLFKRPGTDTPYDHLVVQVNSDIWQQKDDLPAGAGNFYQLNPVTGEIRFGNFDPKSNQPGTYGSIPPQGAQISALTYRHVAGGLSGNVGAGEINGLVRRLDGIVSVINNISSFDAADEEALEDTLRRAPGQLKSHDRAVTAEDYETLARQATSEVVIVRCLPPRVAGPSEANPGTPWSYAGMNRAPGNINVIVVPNQGLGVANPYPSRDLLREVQVYLDERRDLAVNLLVSGPYYLPIRVTATVNVWQTAINQGLATLPSVQADMLLKLQNYLHPVLGGLDGQGWQVGQSVFIADLFKAIMPPENIGFISSLTLAPDTPLYIPATRPPLPPIPPATGPWVNLADYELACYSPASVITPQRT
jgi:predicted phage baseplate assembly protein